MKKPARPPAELHRQRMLESYDILDTGPESAYDDLCQLAAEICQTPVAAISFVDRERQWFKARLGLSDLEGPRDTFFCGHAILDADLTHVPDLRLDERFRGNPLVMGPAGYRFYAGAPLVVPTGEILGTICVMDFEVRDLRPAQRRALSGLARTVVAQLELRRHVGRVIERERSVNESLQAQRREQRARADFLSRVSQELRTPVVGILGMIQAAEGPGLDEARTGPLRAARQAGDGLLGLINKIVDFSALEGQRVVVERSDFDLVALAGKALAVVASAARAQDLRLNFSSATDPECWVSSDPARVQQILSHLLDNAVKFTPKGEVALTLAHEAEHAVITVRDSGFGIPPEVVPRLFRAYSLTDEPSPSRSGGAGLGLPIVKEVVDLLGGTITCRSAPGVGTEFTLRLPMPRATRPDVTPVRGLRVLVVDDVTINQKVLKAMLTPHQAEVHVASSGEQALEMCAAADFDLILMDRYMPGMDGIEATRLIRQHEAITGRRTPILGTSAAIEPGERQHFLDAGADDTVAKPMRMDEFWPKVNRLRAA